MTLILASEASTKRSSRSFRPPNRHWNLVTLATVIGSLGLGSQWALTERLPEFKNNSYSSLSSEIVPVFDSTLPPKLRASIASKTNRYYASNLDHLPLEQKKDTLRHQIWFEVNSLRHGESELIGRIFDFIGPISGSETLMSPEFLGFDLFSKLPEDTVKNASIEELRDAIKEQVEFADRLFPLAIDALGEHKDAMLQVKEHQSAIVKIKTLLNLLCIISAENGKDFRIRFPRE